VSTSCLARASLAALWGEGEVFRGSRLTAAPLPPVPAT
jgi:hypothetical protein